MEHDDREYRDMLREGLRDVEPSEALHVSVRNRIAQNVAHVRRRNVAFRAVTIAIVLTMALSTVTPVFGSNGTLPQVVAAMAAERQAQKMTGVLDTATIEETSAALLVPEATVQAVTDSALSKTDSILALVIADCAGKPVGDVIALRNQGLGWGVIMAQLGISGHDISEALGQAQTVALATTPSTPSPSNSTSSQPAVSNKNGDKVTVNGEIALVPPVSPTSITVAGRTFAIVADTQMKYHGKAITPVEILTKRSAGMLSATVQGTELADKTLRANLVIVQDSRDTAEQEQIQQQTQAGQPTSNAQQIRGKVTIVTPALLRIEGFASDIVLNADTKVEQVGAGKADLTSIKVGQTVQVHVMSSGTTVTAQQVHIEDKYVKTGSDESSQVDPSITTWQGTISHVIVQPGVNGASEQALGVVVLSESGQPTIFWVLSTSVLQDANHQTLTLAALQALQTTAVQKVSIQGTLLSDGTVDVVTLVLTTTSTDSSKPANPGKGKGKH
ncbi:hypothetical protein LLF88_04560 [bacterium]|nr:hypothetical protein [bacterium]